jgi:hypothetical protein
MVLLDILLTMLILFECKDTSYSGVGGGRGAGVAA